MILKKINYLFLVLLLFAANITTAFAQCDASPPSGDPDDTGFDPNCPLDTWVYILVAAAVIFGTYRLYKNNKTTVA